MVDSEDVPQRADQLFDGIADARMAKLTEEGQILADLGVLDRERLAKLTAGDGL